MEDLSHFASDPAAVSVLSLMRAGRWRKARDATKDLCKRDRGRYLPLLIEANLGLARELIGKGLVKDAATVVDYLATIAPPALVAGLRAEMAAPPAKSSAPETAPAGNAGMALAWAAVLRADAALTAGTAAAPADLAEVDALVVDGFCPLPDAERAQRVAAELAAVRVACDATGDGRWDAAQEALRALPGQSVFRHWRMFLRGVRGGFLDQPDMARQCFAGLPAGGALARAARTMAPDGMAGGPVAPAAVRVPLYLAMTQQPAAWAAPILAAIAASKTGKPGNAFLELCAGMKGAFPAITPGLPALLTTAVLPYHSRMKEVDYSAADQLLRRFNIWDDQKAKVAPESILAVAQPMCLAEGSSMKPSGLEAFWGRVVEMWNRCDGPQPQRDSLAWQWLGETLAKPQGGGGFFGFGPPRVDFKKARAALDKAVNCDPANEAAWLALIAALEQQGDTKARNRLVDDLAKRFPTNKDILRRAGMLAVERKAYDKGLAALRAALALDPLDKAIKEQLMIALVLQLREYLKKGRSVAALWEQMEPCLEDRPGHGQFMLARWLARVRQAVLDPVPATATTAFEDAVRLAPSAVERLLAEALLTSVYQAKSRPDRLQDWNAALAAGGHRWATLARMLELHGFLTGIKGWNGSQNVIAISLETQVCTELVADGLKGDLDGLLPFMDQLDAFYKRDESLLFKGLDAVVELLTSAVRKLKGTGKKRPDLRLRMAGFVIDERRAGPYATATPKLLKDLETLAAEATASGMPEVAARAKVLIERLKGREDLYADDFEEDDFDENDEEAQIAELEHLVRVLHAAVLVNDSKALAAARRALRDHGVSDAQINLMIDQLNGLPPKSPPVKPPKPPAPPKPPKPPNPDQFDLF